MPLKLNASTTYNKVERKAQWTCMAWRDGDGRRRRMGGSRGGGGDGDVSCGSWERLLGVPTVLLPSSVEGGTEDEGDLRASGISGV